ncbi:cytochrome P450 [Arthrobacter sp. TMT4-20]
MSALTIANSGGRPVCDFDHHSTAYALHWREMAADLHATGRPLVWTDSNDGGYWVLASHAEIVRVAEDWQTFTSDNDTTGTGNGGRGQAIPQMPYRLFLGESDPPHHTDRRAIEAPYFTPKSLRRLRPVSKHYLHDAIDAVIEQGSADLIDDILIPATARTNLYALGYDPEDYKDAAAVAHKLSYLPHDSPDLPHAEAARMRENFRAALLARRAKPANDLLTSLVNGQVQGEPLSLEEAESMLNALVFGGFDTTASLLAHAVSYLAGAPDVADLIRVDLSVRKKVIEELLRLNPPATGIARTAVRDTEILGQPIAAGERVYMWLAGANRDPLVFPNPDDFDFNRPNVLDHLAFSSGPHRCLGSPLAKVEIEEMLQIIPERLRNLRADLHGAVPYPRLGGVNGFSQFAITFTPGARVNSKHPDLAPV